MHALSDRFVAVSRWYQISIPLLLLAVFSLSFFAANKFDRPSFEILEQRWGTIRSQVNECSEYGYLTGPYLQAGQLPSGYLRQEYQDQVAIMQYVLAPTIVRESITTRCLLVDVRVENERAVEYFAKRNNYRVSQRLGSGRFILTQN